MRSLVELASALIIAVAIIDVVKGANLHQYTGFVCGFFLFLLCVLIGLND